MKKALILCFLLTCILLFDSCKECGCGDPKLIKVKPDAPSLINYRWEMSQAVQHSDGTATSSISIISPGTSSVNASIADSVTTNLYLTASDSLAGVKCITTGGSFAYTCSDPNGGIGISVHGILANDDQCVDLTTCCLMSQRKTITNLSQYINCTNGRVFSGGGLQVVAYIQNCNLKIDTVFMSVNFQS